jgi:hypothetical protein
MFCLSYPPRFDQYWMKLNLKCFIFTSSYAIMFVSFCVDYTLYTTDGEVADQSRRFASTAFRGYDGSLLRCYDSSKETWWAVIDISRVTEENLLCIAKISYDLRHGFQKTFSQYVHKSISPIRDSVVRFQLGSYMLLLQLLGIRLPGFFSFSFRFCSVFPLVYSESTSGTMNRCRHLVYL